MTRATNRIERARSKVFATARGCAVASVTILAPGVAAAHAGHAHAGQGGLAEVLAGLAHPVTGIDHLLVAMGLGLWASRVAVAHRDPAAHASPLAGPGTALVAFVALLAIGMFAAAVIGPAAESVVALTLLVTAGLVALGLRTTRWLMPLIGGAVALVHGLVHGAELGTSPGVVAGLLVGSAALWLVGHRIGTWIPARGRVDLAVRAGAAGCALIAIPALVGA